MVIFFIVQIKKKLYIKYTKEVEYKKLYNNNNMINNNYGFFLVSQLTIQLTTCSLVLGENYWLVRCKFYAWHEQVDTIFDRRRTKMIAVAIFDILRSQSLKFNILFK